MAVIRFIKMYGENFLEEKTKKMPSIEMYVERKMADTVSNNKIIVSF